MTRLRSRAKRLRAVPAAALLLLHVALPKAGFAYVVNSIVADMRQSASVSGGTSCPQQTRFDVSIPGTSAGSGAPRWEQVPATILTADQTPAGQLNEIESTIAQSFGSLDAAFPAARLTASSFGPIRRTSAAECLRRRRTEHDLLQPKRSGIHHRGPGVHQDHHRRRHRRSKPAPASAPSTFVGEILDADILVRPARLDRDLRHSRRSCEQPCGLRSRIGSHSRDWSRAWLRPFRRLARGDVSLRARPPARSLAVGRLRRSPMRRWRTTIAAAVRVLYPDPSDTTHIGSISGHVLPANPLALSGEPAGTTGIFAAQVVAVNAATGAVAAASISGWSCSDPGPADIRRLLQHRAARGRTQPGLSGLRRAARWTSEPDGRLRRVHDVPQRAQRSRLAAAVRLHHAVADHKLSRCGCAPGP